MIIANQEDCGYVHPDSIPSSPTWVGMPSGEGGGL